MHHDEHRRSKRKSLLDLPFFITASRKESSPILESPASHGVDTPVVLMGMMKMERKGLRIEREKCNQEILQGPLLKPEGITPTIKEWKNNTLAPQSATKNENDLISSPSTSQVDEGRSLTLLLPLFFLQPTAPSVLYFSPF